MLLFMKGVSERSQCFSIRNVWSKTKVICFQTPGDPWAVIWIRNHNLSFEWGKIFISYCYCAEIGSWCDYKLKDSKTSVHCEQGCLKKIPKEQKTQPHKNPQNFKCFQCVKESLWTWGLKVKVHVVSAGPEVVVVCQEGNGSDNLKGAFHWC